MVCSKNIFVSDGWERHARDRPQVAKAIKAIDDGLYDGEQMTLEDCNEELKRQQASTERSKRRAKAKFRDYALCGEWKYFVTLTLDSAKVDRYSIKETTKKVGKWLDNSVKRKGLSYVLVPEMHRDGAIHYHGFFSDMAAIDSGTMKIPNVKKPRRVAKSRQAERLQEGWKIVYNLPDWSLGWSTAIELTGNRMQAINYVSKYITKGEEKIGGRWYYSGGILRQPQIEYVNLDLEDMASIDGSYRFAIEGVAEFLIIWTEGVA